MKASPVLITWVAVNNDPFERDRETGSPRIVNGGEVPGPTLTLLCDEESSYAGSISDVVLLYRTFDEGAKNRERRAVEELSTELISFVLGYFPNATITGVRNPSP